MSLKPMSDVCGERELMAALPLIDDVKRPLGPLFHHILYDCPQYTCAGWTAGGHRT
jgi:hypothetical protein